MTPEDAVKIFFKKLKKIVDERHITSKRQINEMYFELIDRIYEILEYLLEGLPLVIFNDYLDEYVNYISYYKVSIDDMTKIFEIIHKFQKVFLFYDIMDGEYLVLQVGVYNYVFESPWIHLLEMNKYAIINEDDWV